MQNLLVFRRLLINELVCLIMTDISKIKLEGILFLWSKLKKFKALLAADVLIWMIRPVPYITVNTSCKSHPLEQYWQIPWCHSITKTNQYKTWPIHSEGSSSGGPACLKTSSGGIYGKQLAPAVHWPTDRWDESPIDWIVNPFLSWLWQKHGDL